jgi:hypothetical protein
VAVLDIGRNSDKTVIEGDELVLRGCEGEGKRGIYIED